MIKISLPSLQSTQFSQSDNNGKEITLRIMEKMKELAFCPSSSLSSSVVLPLTLNWILFFLSAIVRRRNPD